MTASSPPPSDDPRPETLLLIVVGAGIRAELSDRMLAYRLQERMRQWQSEQRCEAPLRIVVCTDLWYLNAPELQNQPAICLGEPEINAATAYHANRLPTAFVIDQTLRVQLDPDYLDLHGCIWGVNHETTVSGVDLFAERYMDDFLRAAHDLAPAE